MTTTLALLFAAEPWTPGHRPTGQGRIQLPRTAAVRPTTLPADHFGVRFSAGLLRDDNLWRGPLLVGADYGVTDNLEVGLNLLRLTLTGPGDGTEGLADPTVFGAARTALGFLELGARAEIAVPLSGSWAAALGGFTRIHLAHLARLDLAFELGGEFDAETRWPAFAPAEALVSLAPWFSLGGGIAFESDDLAGDQDLRFRPTARALIVVNDPRSVPMVDVEARFAGPPSPIRGDREAFDFLVTIEVVLYFDDVDDGPGSLQPNDAWSDGQDTQASGRNRASELMNEP